MRKLRLGTFNKVAQAFTINGTTGSVFQEHLTLKPAVLIIIQKSASYLGKYDIAYGIKTQP